MTETMPDIPDDCAVLAVVKCGRGYQATVQRRVETSFYPHYKHVQIRVVDKTIISSIKAALKVKPTVHHQLMKCGAERYA